MTADLIAPHTPLTKGETMYTAVSTPRPSRRAFRWPGSSRSTTAPAPVKKRSASPRSPTSPSWPMSTWSCGSPRRECARHPASGSGGPLAALLQSTVLLSVRSRVCTRTSCGCSRSRRRCWRVPRPVRSSASGRAWRSTWCCRPRSGYSALVGSLLGFSMGVATAAVDRRAVWLRRWRRSSAAWRPTCVRRPRRHLRPATDGADRLLLTFLVVAVSSVLLVLPVNRLMRWA